MLTFYMVYGQMHRTSCALYYCNDRHSHHSLCLCNLYHLQVLPSTRHLFPPPSVQRQEVLSEDIHLVVVDLLVKSVRDRICWPDGPDQVRLT